MRCMWIKLHCARAQPGQLALGRCGWFVLLLQLFHTLFYKLLVFLLLRCSALMLLTAASEWLLLKSLKGLIRLHQQLGRLPVRDCLLTSNYKV